MSTNDKLIIAFIILGLIITFSGILAIVIDQYKKKEKEKQENVLADEMEIKQKILQMHDYGEFLNKELTDKQNEAMLMYEMLLEKEKNLSTRNYEKNQENTMTARADFSKLNSDTNNAGNQIKPNLDDENNLKTKLISESFEQKNPFNFMQTNNHNLAIQELYDKGLSESEIAKKLQIGKGQVELVIRLYGKS